MVTQYSDHPRSVPLQARKELARLSFGDQGLLMRYIRGHCEWHVGDRVCWLMKGGAIIAWAVRTQEYPYETPSFMVYVKKAYRRQGWGTYLYQQLLKRSPDNYMVYGSHSNIAGNFYTKLGRGVDYD